MKAKEREELFDRLQESFYQVALRKRFFVEMSKAGLGDDELRAVYYALGLVCKKCLNGPASGCMCGSDFY